jgi:hypothetical protein
MQQTDRHEREVSRQCGVGKATAGYQEHEEKVR